MDNTSIQDSQQEKFVVEWKGQNYLMLPIPSSTNIIPTKQIKKIQQEYQNQSFSETIGSAKYMSPQIYQQQNILPKITEIGILETPAQERKNSTTQNLPDIFSDQNLKPMRMVEYEKQIAHQHQYLTKNMEWPQPNQMSDAKSGLDFNLQTPECKVKTEPKQGNFMPLSEPAPKNQKFMSPENDASDISNFDIPEPHTIQLADFQNEAIEPHLVELKNTKRSQRIQQQKTISKLRSIKILPKGYSKSIQYVARKPICKSVKIQSVAQNNFGPSFFYVRSCFRYVNEYFKQKFNEFAANHDPVLPTTHIMRLSEINAILIQFLHYQFAIKNLDDDLKDQFAERMIPFIFSHRHEKDDKFIVEMRESGKQLDFETVRDVMYKYSKKAQERYLESPVECFFLYWFGKSSEGRDFIDKKSDSGQIRDKTDRLHKEMDELQNQALLSLNVEEKSGESNKLKQFIIEKIEMINH